MREHHRAAIEFLVGLGAREVRVRGRPSGHPAIEWRLGDREYRVTMSCSPKSPGVAGRRIVAQIKQTISKEK